MRLEGRMVGAWIPECRQAWLALKPSLSSKKLALDLRGVTFIDEAGLLLMREIYDATRADLITHSPLTKHFAQQITASSSDNSKGALE